MAFKLKNLASAESGYIQRTDFSRFLFTQKISCLVLAFKELKPKNPESKLSNSRTELEENIWRFATTMNLPIFPNEAKGTPPFIPVL